MRKENFEKIIAESNELAKNSNTVIEKEIDDIGLHLNNRKRV